MIQCAIREWETGAKKTVFFEGSISEGMLALRPANDIPRCGSMTDVHYIIETFERSIATWYQQGKPRRDWIAAKIQKKTISNSAGGMTDTIGRTAPIENRFNHCMDDLVDSDNECRNMEGSTLPRYPWRVGPPLHNAYPTPLPSTDDANPQDTPGATAAPCESETDDLVAPKPSTLSKSSSSMSSPCQRNLDAEDINAGGDHMAGNGLDENDVCSFVYLEP